MTRATVHQMLDELPDTELDDVATLLDAYRHDRVLVQSLLAPEVSPEPDETPVSEDEIRDAEPGDQVLTELGLL